MVAAGEYTAGKQVGLTRRGWREWGEYEAACRGVAVDLTAQETAVPG